VEVGRLVIRSKEKHFSTCSGNSTSWAKKSDDQWSGS
jgi:hypothetical protein